MKGKIFEIICKCGLRFSDKIYYEDHLDDVEQAIWLIKHKHGMKKVFRLKQ